MTSDLVAGLAGWSMLMSRSSSVFTAPALEWRIDLAKRPAIGERRDGRPIGALILAIGTLWLAVPLPTLLGNAPFPIVELGRSGAWASLGIGMALVLWGLRTLLRRQTIRINDDRVDVTTRAITGTTAWSEPLANYRGVVWRGEPIRRRGDRQTLHLIDLWHEDRSRTLTLLSSTSELAARDAWQGWAQRLGLAAIHLGAGEEHGFAEDRQVAAEPAGVPAASLAAGSNPTRPSR
jgi:hypothetical protein